MMNKPKLTVQVIADSVGGKVEGDGKAVITAVASIESAGPGDVTFAVDERRAARLLQSKASAAIVGKYPPSAPLPLIRVDDVEEALATVLMCLAPAEDRPAAGIHPTAVIAPDAQIAGDVCIGPWVTVGSRTVIGARSVLMSGACVGNDVVIGQDVVLYEGAVVRYGCQIGNRVQIGSNSVIGYEGFGYYTRKGEHKKVPHIGNVVIEDDVEIGACSCVDRAKFGSTRIGAGSKIDNFVQVAHNVQIGKGCLLAGRVGVSGSARLGNYVVVGGATGIRDNVTIGNGAVCYSYSAILSDIPDGETVFGIPAGPIKERLRQSQAITYLPDLLKKMRSLQERVDALESSKNNKDAR